MNLKYIFFVVSLLVLITSCKELKYNQNFSRVRVTEVDYVVRTGEIPTETLIEANTKIQLLHPNLKIAVYPRTGGYSTMIVRDSTEEDLDNKIVATINSEVRDIIIASSKAVK